MLTPKKRFRSHLGAAFTLLLAGSAITLSVPRVALAQNAPTVGVLDQDKLADGYKKYKEAVDALDKKFQLLDSQIPARELLSEDEGKNFDALIIKASPTADENTKLQALVKLGMDKRANFMSLNGKAERTPKDIADMKLLQDQMAKNAPSLRAISDALMALIREQQDSTDKLYTDRVNSVIGQVGSDKKFSMIVLKKALAWSADSVDVTDEVLKRLNSS